MLRGVGRRRRRVLKGARESAGDGDAGTSYDTGTLCNPLQTGQCAAGQSCRYFGMNPSADLMSYDNVGVGFVVLFQARTARLRRP